MTTTARCDIRSQVWHSGKPVPKFNRDKWAWERQYILDALALHKFDVSATASYLEMHRQSLQSKMKALGIKIKLTRLFERELMI